MPYEFASKSFVIMPYDFLAKKFSAYANSPDRNLNFSIEERTTKKVQGVLVPQGECLQLSRFSSLTIWEALQSQGWRSSCTYHAIRVHVTSVGVRLWRGNYRRWPLRALLVHLLLAALPLPKPRSSWGGGSGERGDDQRAWHRNVHSSSSFQACG